jgi:hypothetical protein
MMHCVGRISLHVIQEETLWIMSSQTLAVIGRIREKRS